MQLFSLRYLILLLSKTINCIVNKAAKLKDRQTDRPTTVKKIISMVQHKTLQ